MAQPLVSWVIDHSPYKGIDLLLHVVIADRVDYRLELRVSQRWLSEKARVSRAAVSRFLTKAEADGALVPIGTGPRSSVDYRLVDPTGNNFGQTGNGTNMSQTNRPTGTQEGQSLAATGTPLATPCKTMPYIASTSTSKVANATNGKNQSQSKPADIEPPTYRTWEPLPDDNPEPRLAGKAALEAIARLRPAKEDDSR